MAEVGLAACDPTDAVERRLRLRGRTLIVDDRSYELGDGGVIVVGAGKASLTLAQALEAHIGACIDEGLVVVPEGGSGRLEHIACCEASHPCPARRARRRRSRSCGSCARRATGSC